MAWNYRVIQHTDEKTDSVWFHIHTVFYSDSGKIESWIENPTTPIGDSVEDLKGELELIMAAWELPVLKPQDNRLVECDD